MLTRHSQNIAVSMWIRCLLIISVLNHRTNELQLRRCFKLLRRSDTREPAFENSPLSLKSDVTGTARTTMKTSYGDTKTLELLYCIEYILYRNFPWSFFPVSKPNYRVFKRCFDMYFNRRYSIYPY